MTFVDEAEPTPDEALEQLLERLASAVSKASGALDAIAVGCTCAIQMKLLC